MPKIESIARWICKKLTKNEVAKLVDQLKKLLDDNKTIFKNLSEKLPNYRNFKVEPLKPIKKLFRNAIRKNYKKIVKKKNIPPIRRHKGNKNIPPNDLKCPFCNAPSNYIYVNNGKPASQFKCTVCEQTFNPNAKKELKSKYRCPYCGSSLFLWKRRKLVDIYKCGNKNCGCYRKNYNNLSEKEKKIFKKKTSQFKLHYQYRKYKIGLESVINKKNPAPVENLYRSRYSLKDIGLVLTFYITLQHTSRETAFTMDHVFGIKISHTHVLNIVKQVAKLCYNFNLENTPEIPGEQAADETYIDIRHKHNYIWLAVAKFRSILTFALLSDNRGEMPALKLLINAFYKHKKEKNKPFTFVTDGNPSYASATQFLQTEYKFNIEHKKVIGLKNLDKESALYRYLKNTVERINRTFNHYVNDCFKNPTNLAGVISLSFTDYNFIRPHSSNNYEPPVVLNELKNTHLLQDKWAWIIQSQIA